MADNKTVLFVDDEPAVLSSLKRMLREENWNLLFAETGAEGLRLLGEHKVDVVVVDLQMPQMNGLSFLEEVVEKSPTSGRIVLSAYVHEGSLERAMVEEYADQILSKPWDDTQVKAAIHVVLDQ